MAKVSQPQTWDHEVDYRQRKVLVLADLSLSDNRRLGRYLHTCDYCGRDFCPTRSGVMYCKRSCAVMASQKRANLKQPLPMRDCDQCGENYQPKRSTSAFCSAKCRVKYNRGLRAARPNF